jgi:hypothetical protein
VVDLPGKARPNQGAIGPQASEKPKETTGAIPRMLIPQFH